MDVISTILAVIAISVLIGVAVTFGFALLTFIISVAFVTALLITFREWYYRWRFTSEAERRESQDVKIIDVEYKEIKKTDE